MSSLGHAVEAEQLFVAGQQHRLHKADGRAEVDVGPAAEIDAPKLNIVALHLVVRLFLFFHLLLLVLSVRVSVSVNVIHLALVLHDVAH